MPLEVKARKIKAFKYYLFLVINIFQIGFIIYSHIIYKLDLIYCFITNWSYALSSFYLFAVLICDTSLYFFSSKKLEKFHHFMRNLFSNVAFPYNFMITIGFWGILLIGIIFSSETFLKEGTEITFQTIFVNVHLHLGITIFMIIDLFMHERNEVKLNWCSCISNTVIYDIYCSFYCVLKYYYNINPYLFTNDFEWWQMLLVGIGIYAILFGCIFIYNAISNKINKDSMRIIDSEEDLGLITSENTEDSGIITPGEF